MELQEVNLIQKPFSISVKEIDLDPGGETREVNPPEVEPGRLNPGGCTPEVEPERLNPGG